MRFKLATTFAQERFKWFAD